MLLGIGINLLYVEQVSIARDLRSQEERACALLLAQEWLELAETQVPTLPPQTWRSIMPRRYDMDCVMEVRPHPVHPYMREVMVTVSWKNASGGPAHTVRLARLVPDHLGGS